MGLSSKENLWRALVKHQKPEWIPSSFSDLATVGGGFETFENGPAGGGADGFGVIWHPTTSASGQPVPVPNSAILKDILHWEEVIVFPDLDAYDWNVQATLQLARANRSEQGVEYMMWNDVFLRLTHVMGFENALIALALEPEACTAFFEAVTTYKIRLVERIHEYFKPDFISHFDDVATETGLFISPECYRALIKPHHTRLNNAIKERGIMPIQHCCGKCETLIEDFIEEGVIAWSSAQPMNDIVGLQKKYGSQISIVGGYNTNGRPGMPGVMADEIEQEVQRCLDAYGPQGSYVFSGILLGNDPSVDFVSLHMPLIIAAQKLGKSWRYPA